MTFESTAIRRSHVPSGTAALDETNRRLLELLTADPRASAPELARAIGMSAPAVRERLQRLHDSGVIDDEEYTAARTRLLESLRS